MSEAEVVGACGEEPPAKWAIIAHGGAGDLSAERRTGALEGCAAAAEIGARVLRAGGSALDAVEAIVIALEDDPRFSAGVGSALNEDGDIELDAAIMDGLTLRVGGVVALPPFRHPIAIARAVLEDGRHVLYAAEGGARFALAHGFARATLEEMRTPYALERWRDVRDSHRETAGGTVGAVARDVWGHVAAATSTGGTVDKHAGRVGDSAIPGAGTWADDMFGACSTTGHGEAFLRTAFASSAVRDLDGGRSDGTIGRATLARLRAMAVRTGGDGGAILVDREGRVAWARTTRSMSWALVRCPDRDDDERRAAGT